MFKLLFSSAMIAPVLLFAVKGATTNESVFDTADTTSFTSAQMMDTCRSETLPVVFHDTIIESHSAAALRSAFESSEACETSFVRLTALVAEESDKAHTSAKARRMELAATIAAIIGDDAARTLPVHTDVRTAAAESPIHHHALVRIERRPSELKTTESSIGAMAGLPSLSDTTISTLN